MTYEYLRVEQDGPALVIRFNRPKQRNALSLGSIEELMRALAAADADKTVRVVILTGNDDVFSAGADLNDALKIKTAEDGISYFRKWHRLCDALETLTKPTIAAIEGHCMTGGFELALACDIRIAGKSAAFTITSSRIGTVAGAGGTQRLPRIVGRANALDIMFSAEAIDGAEAYRIGLLNRLVEDGDALAEAKRRAAVYASRAPLSLALVKRAIHRGMDMDLASSLEFETFLVTTIYGTEDKQEGISAFLEKRPAKFQGK
ncbi:MAG: enoyl-CoA hydratase/isomerase family protein [Bradyrhizobium sp.]|nr:enoyl-CoA hydratase/isomerase family protein [Bradyrhizobium sp.]